MVRYFALLMGIAFVLAGIGGFVPGITQSPHADMPEMALSTSYGLLLGLFPINLLHNLIHLALGVWGLAAFRAESSARLYCRALAITLAIFVMMGVLPALSTTFGLLPLFGHDIWLHGLEAAVAFYLGYVYKTRFTREVHLGNV
ncbi:MAG: DUF4383 domain-containing protein [Anaerolineae bacterium]|nr:DUF4383 domain-containing protein [Anaerolineae bacterium]